MTYFVPQRLSLLSLNGVRLESLGLQHVEGLACAVQDGDIYQLLVTSAPMPDKAIDYVQSAIEQQQNGNRYAFAVLDEVTQQVIGSTSLYEPEEAIKRIKIGYTWYAKRYQRTHVNTTCKLLLLQYVFEVLKANTVVFETDVLNTTSQKAIERLGATKDGVLRGHKLRKDGTLRDTVVYSIIAEEWLAVKEHLNTRLNQSFKS